jgi:molybdenum cofactor cytidylyltransferase
LPLSTPHTGIVILAAGASRRLGTPKQLLDHGGIPLLAHAAGQALASGLQPVVAVLGAGADRIAPLIAREGLTTAVNARWQEGMAASVRCGLSTLIDLRPDIQAAILMVCDQPHLSADILRRLPERQAETGLPAVACTYAGQLGTPALFLRPLFGELLQLEGDTGARKWLAAHPRQVATLPFEPGALDIDTPDDLSRWKNPPNPGPS